MTVTVGGKEYVIDGVPFGAGPAWQLIKHDGKPMTHELFDKLPDADKGALMEHVKQHIENLSAK